jgi:hypothetical protein
VDDRNPFAKKMVDLSKWQAVLLSKVITSESFVDLPRAGLAVI